VCLAGGAGADAAFARVDPASGARNQHTLDALPAGWRLIDYLGRADGSWVVVEALPGPPDRVGTRLIAADGAELWRREAGAGEPAALAQLLTDADEALYGVTSAMALVAISAETGAVEARGELGGAGFMNGAGTVGHLAERAWVTLDASSGERRELPLSDASGRDVALGMDAACRPYWSRRTTLWRTGPGGGRDWELEVRNAVLNGDSVWIEQDGLLARELNAHGASVRLQAPPDEDRTWRLVGRAGAGFVLHGFTDASDPGVLAAISADSTKSIVEPAPDDVWVEWWDVQRPSDPCVTDAGEIDLAVRAPDGLHLIRITPSP
jgi:hypothetical protein